MMRLVAMVLACACVASQAAAADAAGSTNTTHTLGRLFFAPAQRAQLDTARAQRDRRGLATPDVTQPETPQGPEVVTYSGMVRRNDGKSTVWINGKPMTERTRGGEVSVTSVRGDGTVSVAVPQADRSASLRVGQSVDVMSGRIEEPYSRRATLNRTSPAPAAAPAAAPATEPAKVATPAIPKRATRREEKEADPASGAAPAIRRSVAP